MREERKIKVLFLCAGNSARSQMAEAFLRSRADEKIQIFSAGLEAKGLHPAAVTVMQEIGIDISQQRSKTLDDLGTLSFDLIVTLCESAKEHCRRMDSSCSPSKKIGSSPLFVGVPIVLHWEFADPAQVKGTAQEILSAFRSIRDQIKKNIDSMFELGYLQAFATQRDHLEHFIDALDQGIIVHDKNKNIYLFNQAAERITGYNRREVLGRNCHQVFHPDGLCGSLCNLKKATDILLHDTGQYEVSFSTKQGEQRRLKISASPMQIQSDGPSGIIATIQDITEVSELRFKLKERYSFHGMVGVSSAMQEVFETIRQVTGSDYPVLITGESGTGKELVARAIHNESRRSAGPFVPINCGALPENILESELFGHVRGAFTGAIRDKKGRFELADKGTLFLDEVGELSPAFQVKLLRVLEEKQFEMVGGEKTVHVDVRLISATNRNLKEMVQSGNFREDLYYRLAVVPIKLPPLRDRREDIPSLVEQVLGGIRQDLGTSIDSLSDAAMDLFLAYRWPGNIRELINALQFASVRCGKGNIQPQHLPLELRERSQLPDRASKAPETGLSAKKVGKLDQESVARALKEAGGNKVKAAKILGVGRATLYRFLR